MLHRQTDRQTDRQTRNNIVKRIHVIARSIVKQCDVAIQKASTCFLDYLGFSATRTSVHRSNLFGECGPDCFGGGLKPSQYFKSRNKVKRVKPEKQTLLFPFSFSLFTSFRQAMTLAEVLITLGIIGIVAAMTIPTLIQKQQEQQTVVSLKKAYSTLSNAYTLAIQENGTPENWDLDTFNSAQGAINLMNNFIPFLSIQKKCLGTSSSMFQGCFKDITYRRVGGNPWVNINETSALQKVILNDGMSIAAQIHYNGCTTAKGTVKNVCASFLVDINGFKTPNQGGVDTFEFWVTKTGIVPMGVNGDITTFDGYCKTATTNKDSYGWGCAAWVIYNENMDYLHCDGLSWTGKHTCD